MCVCVCVCVCFIYCVKVALKPFAKQFFLQKNKKMMLITILGFIYKFNINASNKIITLLSEHITIYLSNLYQDESEY